MAVTFLNGYPDSLAAYRTARNSGVPVSRSETGGDALETPKVSLPAVTPKSVPETGTRLISEQQIDLENGYRRTRTFEQADGRTFTKIEDFALTEQGARRSVVQQNPSGSITRYEEILDRDGGGTFRRTQRFQDEAGDVAAQITSNYQVTDPFVLTSGGSAPSLSALSAFDSLRGTQLDLRV